VYVFPTGAERHGIIRYVPTEARYDDRYDRRFPIDGESVEAAPVPGQGRGDPSTAGRLKLTTEKGYRVFRVGDANQTVSGTWQYTIRYRVHDVVEPVAVEGAPMDEVVWNAIGTQWGIPIRNVTTTFTSPAEPLSTRCFAGARGSTELCDDGSTSGATMVRRVRSLAPYEGVTLAVDLPRGTVPGAKINLVERWTAARAFEVTPMKAGLAGGLALLAGAGMAVLLGRQARDRRLAMNAYLPAAAEPDTEGLVGFFGKADGPVRFRPPEDATPGLVGVVMDEKADPLDVSATLVDLAVRGYLRIEEMVDHRGRPKRDDFRLRRLKDPDDSLLPYERELLQRLWEHDEGDGTVTLQGLRRAFASDLDTVRDEMYKEVTRRGWFVRRPDRVRVFWYVIGGLVAGLGVLASIPIAATTHWGLMALPLLVPGLVLLFAARHMPARTSAGRKVLEEAVGYERFLDVADADQLRFQEEQMQFLAALPYAMIFGLTRKWADVLSVLQERGLELYPAWYLPYDAGAPFRFALLGASMDNFGSVSSSALSMPAASSSGGGGFGGGGGFSGGGGGGGGGGSW
jgi:uncharacterized membrane protein YgcG